MPGFDEDNKESPILLEGDEDKDKRWFVLFWIGLPAALLIGAFIIFLASKAPETIRIIQSRDCLSCHAELRDSLKDKSVHTPFLARQCTGCHTTHGLELARVVETVKRFSPLGYLSDPETKKNERLPADKSRNRYTAPRPKRRSKLTRPLGALCGDTCHANLVSAGMAKRYKMKPFAEKQCTGCHSPHSSKTKPLLKARIKPLCLSCHRTIAKYYKSDNLHPPFEAGSCNSCHRAHASEIKPLLRGNTKVLCLSCHRRIAKLMKRPVKMEPFEEGACPKCHNPHGSPNKKLLQSAMPQLCFDCHEKIAKLRKKPVQMEPFRQGLCLGCHEPHASASVKLLRADLENNAICYRCHEEVKKNYEPIGHNRTTNNASAYQPEGGIGSCLNCHEPHGSDFSGLIQKESISLCFTCHGPRRYFAHPFGLKWVDPWRGGYLRCTSCHNPMGSGITRLKRRDRDGLCISCHWSEDPAYIYSDKWPEHGYKIPDSI